MDMAYSTFLAQSLIDTILLVETNHNTRGER